MNSFEEFFLQELIITKKVTLYKRARYRLPDGCYITAALPEFVDGHFGNGIKEYITTQYHVNNVSQNKICQDLVSRGISIAEGSVDKILANATRKLEPEHDGILEAMKEVSSEIRVDDTDGKHNGQKHIHIVFQNDLCTYIQSSPSKSRKNFLRVLQGQKELYVVNDYTIAYLERCRVNDNVITKIKPYLTKQYETLVDWKAFLKTINIDELTTGKKTLLALEEAALLGALIHQSVSPELLLLSDGAPQFKKMFTHALCWIHAERIIKRLIACNDDESVEINKILQQLWEFYRKLVAFKKQPTDAMKQELIKGFDVLFLQTVQSVQLGRALVDMYKLKAELLRVLDYPFIDLHNNSSERDIRSVVCKRKVSGSTRSITGQKARNIFPSIIKTCQKLGISALHFIRDRLSQNPTIQPLSELIKAKNDLNKKLALSP